MTKTISRASIGALLSLLLNPTTAIAAVEEEVIVTASPLGKAGDTLSQPATSLSGDELRRKVAATLGESLKDEPGMSSASFGPGVGAPVIRGQSANRVKVMQDHLGSMDASSSSPDHASSVEPLLAERIEVLRGPATLRYGNDAIGGVVNVIDNRIPDQVIEDFQGAAEFRYQSVNQQGVGVAYVEAGNGQFAWHLDAVKRDSSDVAIPGYASANPSAASRAGQIDNTDTRASAVSLGGSRFSEQGFVGIAVSQRANNYGIPAVADDADELIRIDMEQTRFDLKGEQRQISDFIESINYRLAYNDYQHTELEGSEAGTQFINRAWEGRFEVVHNSSDTLRGAVGLQAGLRHYSAIGDEAFIPKSEIQNGGIFALQEMRWGDWVIEIGGRAERQSIDAKAAGSADFTTFSLSGAAHWHFTETQHLTASVARAQRAPAVEELYAYGAHMAEQNFVIGNADLNSETSTNLELAYHYEGPIHLQLNAFNNRIDDFIYKANSGTELEALPVYAYSQQAAHFYGAEAQMSIPFADYWQWQLFTDSVRARFVDGSDVPRVTPARVGTAIEYSDDNWQAELRLSRSEKQQRAGDQEYAVAAYTRLDFNLSHAIALSSGEDLLLFARANNLTNATIRNANSFLRAYAPEPGRSVEVGARLNF